MHMKCTLFSALSIFAGGLFFSFCSGLVRFLRRAVFHSRRSSLYFTAIFSCYRKDGCFVNIFEMNNSKRSIFLCVYISTLLWFILYTNVILVIATSSMPFLLGLWLMTSLSLSIIIFQTQSSIVQKLLYVCRFLMYLRLWHFHSRHERLSQ